jgi:hypothetical protein
MFNVEHLIVLMLVDDFIVEQSFKHIRHQQFISAEVAVGRERLVRVPDQLLEHVH